MKIGSDLLVPDSSKVLLYRGLRPVYFALEAKVEAFYHIARARWVVVDEAGTLQAPVLRTPPRSTSISGLPVLSLIVGIAICVEELL